MFKKSKLRKSTVIEDKQPEKKERGHFEQRTSSKKSTDSGCFEQQEGVLHIFFWIFWTYEISNHWMPLLQPEHMFYR